MNRTMHAYRTHHCGELRASQIGERVKLSGWIHRKRDHGGVLFVDLRDHYGLTQIVGKVVSRGPEATNPNLPTGEIEVSADEVIVQSSAEELPLPVAGEADYPE